MIELSNLEKMDYLLDHVSALHDKRMAVRHHDKIAHAFHLCALYGYDSVIRAWENHRRNKVETDVAGDDSQVKVNRPQIVWNTPFICSKLLTGWPVLFFKKITIFEIID